MIEVLKSALALMFAVIAVASAVLVVWRKANQSATYRRYAKAGNRWKAGRR